MTGSVDHVTGTEKAEKCIYKQTTEKSYPSVDEEYPQGRNVRPEDLPRQTVFLDAHRVERCAVPS